MAFITGPMASANTGADIYALIEAQAIALGYTLVDTVVFAGETHKVLKSAAAGNSRGLDWYLDIQYPTTGVATPMYFRAFEDYNSTTKLAFRGPVITSTTVEQTYYSRLGATGNALNSSNWAASSTSYTNMIHPLVSSAISYYISITRNRLVLMMSNNTSKIAYAGFYIPTTAFATFAGASLYPLISATLVPGSSSSSGSIAATTAAVTRAPKAPNNGNFDWSGSVLCSANLSSFGAGMIGGPASFFLGETVIAPYAVTLGRGSTTPGNAEAPGFVGQLDGVAQGYVITTAIRGDYVSVGADQWFMTTPSGNQTALMQGI